MTLAEIIAAFEERRSPPAAPHDVRAPLGDATTTLYRMKR